MTANENPGAEKSTTYTRIIDAFHSQLAIDVKDIGESVRKHVESLPAVYKEFEAHSLLITQSASKATDDFQAMLIASMNIAKKRNDMIIAETKVTSELVAKNQKASLEVFTRYFWLVIGLSGVNFIALMSCIVIVFLFQKT